MKGNLTGTRHFLKRSQAHLKHLMQVKLQIIQPKVLIAKKVLKCELTVEAIIIFVKSLKKGIECYGHFISKSVILTVIIFCKIVIKELTKCLNLN